MMDNSVMPLQALILSLGLLLLSAFISGCGGSHVAIREPASRKSMDQCVVLLHGLGRSHHSMKSIQQALAAAGYHTVNVGYPSTKESVETIISTRFYPGYRQCEGFETTAVHFVTHSLGGIILRKAFSEEKPEDLGRVVMLSPPNQGSSIVDTIKDWWIFQWVTGPAGQRLSTDADSLPNQLGPVDYPVGVITGNKHAFFDSWFASLIPGKDDGKVSVESARLEGMSDFLVVDESHPYIMQSRYVQSEILNFLRDGRFAHKEEPLPAALGEDWYSRETSVF